MAVGDKSQRTSPACKNIASCAGFAPEPSQGLLAGSRRSIVALASVAWPRTNHRTATLHVARKPDSLDSEKSERARAMGSGPNFIDLESQAEDAGRQSGLHQLLPF
jgi:hypothetical protein